MDQTTPDIREALCNGLAQSLPAATAQQVDELVALGERRGRQIAAEARTERETS